MRYIFYPLFLLWSLSFSGEPGKTVTPPDVNPLTDKLLMEVAKSQVDYLLAKEDADACPEAIRRNEAKKAMQAKYEEAETICRAFNLRFNPKTLSCFVPAPPPVVNKPDGAAK